jgi:hypothetical protein
MIQTQEQLCLDQCQIEASEYGLVSNPDSNAIARRKDNSNLLSQNLAARRRFAFGLIAQRADRSWRRQPVYGREDSRTVCRSPNLLFGMRLNSKSDGLLGLFDLDFCSSGFNLLLDLFRFFFGDSFFDRLGSAFDQGFRFGES